MATRKIRYIESLDLPMIHAAAKGQRCNRILPNELVGKLVEEGNRLPLVFEMLHERGKQVEIRVVAVINAAGTTVTFDVPIAWQDAIQTAVLEDANRC